MIAAVDVYYMDSASARAGAVVFAGFSDTKAYRTYVYNIPHVEEYVPGQFYLRELPCIMSILSIIEEEIDIVIIDGYVDLGDRRGLGRYLWNTLGGKKKVIGVAKTHFAGANAIKVYRRNSRQPLFITAAGIEQTMAAGLIASMHGRYRLPALIKQADMLSRSGRSGLPDH
jgi:deoxyribonuclease V